MDLVRFFIMVIWYSPPVGWIWWAYSPMTARIWPMVCMERIRFFFMFIIIYTSKIELGKVYWKLSVDMLQQRAVSGHGLLDLFFCGVSHLWEPPNMMKVFGIQLAGAALRCPQRGGIIAPAEAGKKWLN